MILNLLNKKWTKIILISLVLAWWVKNSVSPLMLPMSTNEMDSYSRLAHVVLKLQSNIWLPGFKYIMGIFSWIPDNGTLLNYRIGIYIFTILSAVLIYKILKQTTNKWIVSFLGSTFFLFHPLTIQLSVLTLTEPVWIFFLLLSLYFLIVNKKGTVFCLMSFIVSETIRYESWFLIPLIILYLFISKEKKQKIILISISLFLIPLIWLFKEYFFYGNGFVFISEQIHLNSSIFSFSSIKINVLEIIQSLISNHIFPFWTSILILITGVFLKNKKIALVSISGLLLLVILILEFLFGFTDNFAPRFFYYLIPTISIILPIFLYKIFCNSNNKIWALIYLALITLVIWRNTKTLDNTFYSKMSENNIAIKQIIRNMGFQREENVFICVPEYEYQIQSLLLYQMQYKNVYNCLYKDIFKEENHGKLIVLKEESGKFENKIKWSSKENFMNYTVYRF